MARPRVLESPRGHLAIEALNLAIISHCAKIMGYDCEVVDHHGDAAGKSPNALQWQQIPGVGLITGPRPVVKGKNTILL